MTSALTALIEVNRADLLQRLYTTILIPPAVLAELQVIHSVLPGFIEVASVQNEKELAKLSEELHVGDEAEAIVLAKERGWTFF